MSIHLFIAAGGWDIAQLVSATRAGSNVVYSALIPWVFLAAFGMLVFEAYKVFQGSTTSMTGALLRIAVAVGLLTNFHDWTGEIGNAINGTVQTIGNGGGQDQLMADYAAFLQQFLLLITIAAAPVFIGLWMLTGTRGIGMRYFLTLMSIELWPLGWALGNIVTKQMLAAVASTGGAWLQLESTVFVVVGLWIIINAVFWPILISKALVSGGTHAGNWILESVSPVLSAGQGAVNVATTAASGGGAAVQAGGLSLASRPTKSPKA